MWRCEEGLRTAQRAVEIRERLAEANPDAYLPDLATSLNTLAVRLGEAGRREERLRTAQRVSESYQELVARHPGSFGGMLARSLINLGKRLINVGRIREGPLCQSLVRPGAVAVALSALPRCRRRPAAGGWPGHRAADPRAPVTAAVRAHKLPRLLPLPAPGPERTPA
ncbi:hypothetical protein GCM10022419_134060 [Nonomuraea rosea]|uniref:Tetratricopeptide repeat protein n=1 Tax=Nonomuraea rosea TaxID=638574 RepID=A0ABP7A678_9ACTN